jgi:predicted MFS family arabinose efflux permease
MTTDTAPNTPAPRFVPTLIALTLARLVLNGVRRFPYVIFPSMVTALGVTPAVLQAALSLQWATGLLSPFAGPASDRLGRRRMMLLGIGSLAVATGFAAMTRNPTLVLVAIVGCGLSKMLYDPAMQAYVGDRTPYARRAEAIGVTELSWSGAQFVVGPLAAYLIVYAGLGAVYAALAAGSVLAFLLLLAFVPGDAPARQRVAAAALPAGTALRLLRASRPALAMLGAAALTSFAIENMAINYATWLRVTFAADDFFLGALALPLAVAELAGEGFVIFAADRLGKLRLLLVTLVATGILYAVLPATGADVRLAVAALIVMFLLFETSMVVMIPLATEALPAARGTMMSANVAAFALGRAIGTPLGGWLFLSGGYILNGALALAANLLAALLIWRCVKETRH